MKEINHLTQDCTRLKLINSHRGKFPPVEVNEEGYISWVDREPTPSPEDALKESIGRLEEKMDILLKQQAQLLEMMSKPQEDKPKAGGSKPKKSKKPKEAKE